MLQNFINIKLRQVSKDDRDKNERKKLTISFVTDCFSLSFFVSLNSENHSSGVLSREGFNLLYNNKILSVLKN
jgi:hypothetical protein